MTSSPQTTQGFYLYGVVPAGTTVPRSAGGMGEGEVTTHERDGLAIVGEWVDVSRPLGRKRHLVAHSEVLNALALDGPVLPMQFGSVVESEDAAGEQFLAPAADRLWALLEQLRDRVQYVVRARYQQDVVLADVVRQDPEIAELRRLTSGLPETSGHTQRVRLGELVSRALEHRRNQDSAWLLARVEEATVGIVPRSIAGMDALAEFAVSVLRDRQEDFEGLMEELAEEIHPWARLSLVGPMALYDFVPEA